MILSCVNTNNCKSAAARILILGSLVLGMSASIGRAQSAPDSRVDVFAGYSYLNIDLNGVYNRQSLNGWEAAATFNLTKVFGAEGDVSGYYKGNFLFFGGAHDYVILGGPRINYRRFYVHALFGADAFTIGPDEDTGFASAFGGGVELPIRGKLSFRAGADYLLTHHVITQNDLRASVGFTYHFGR